MGQDEAWEAYFYPETYDPLNGFGTLRNLLGERHSGRLHEREYELTATRVDEFRNGQVTVPHTFDADHLKAIHQHLFQDVYEWAGQFRTVNMSKEPSDFALIGGGIESYLSDAHRLVVETEWAGLDRRGFGERAGTVFAYLNQAHPFREGNGRTSKVFMEHVAEQSQFTLDYSRISPRLWNQQSALSGPDRGAYRPHGQHLWPVFEQIAVERADPSTPKVGQHTAQAITSASYPKPAEFNPSA